MNQIDSELAQAESEVSFWRDFVQWWEAKNGQPVEPRAHEALAEAEQRYSDAKAQKRVDQKDGRFNQRSKYDVAG